MRQAKIAPKQFKNIMKRILILLSAAAMLFAVSCQQNPPQQNNVTIQSSAPAGFDVNKLAQQTRKSN